MIISYDSGTCKIRFAYRQDLIDVMRSLSSKKWNPAPLRCWEATPTVVENELLPKLRELDIYPTIEGSYYDFKNNKEEIKDFGLKFPLYSYQLEGANKLYVNESFALFHEMGLGKTVMSIAAMDKLFKDSSIRNALIVCPSSLKKQWFHEIEKFSDLRATIIGGTRAKREKLWCSVAKIKICNYELIRFDYDKIKEQEFDLVIGDEISRIKNRGTKTAMLMKRLFA